MDALEKQRAYNREWMRRYRATPEGIAANRAARNKRNRTPEGREVKRAAHRRWKKSEKGRAYAREWERTKRKRGGWSSHISKTYGLTVEQFEAMAVDGCNICGKPDAMRGRKLFVDHCHTTGKVRGALCDGCNRGIGAFRDDPEILEKAILYLRRHHG